VVATEVPEATEPAHSSAATGAVNSAAADPAPVATSFRQTLDAASQIRPEPAVEPVSLPLVNQPAPTAPASAMSAPSATAMTTAEQDARDYLRSREIVDLVRDEIAALRREFRMRQQSAAWQAQVSFPAAVAPLVQALQDAGIPGALRTLLLDSLSQCNDAQQGLQAMREQLTHHLQRPRRRPALARPASAGRPLGRWQDPDGGPSGH